MCINPPSIMGNRKRTSSSDSMGALAGVCQSMHSSLGVQITEDVKAMEILCNIFIIIVC